MKKYRFLRVSALLLALLIAAGGLTSCGISEAIRDLLSAPVVTTTEVPGNPEEVIEVGGHAVTRRQLNAFLALVDQSIVSRVESKYKALYVLDYRSVDDCREELSEYLIGNYYIERVTDVNEATSIFVNGYMDVIGDRFGYYYAPNATDSYNEMMEGEYSGIGVSVTLNENNYIDILTVFADSPAEEAGMLPGDVLVAVEGEDIAAIGYQETINRIRGEVGTSVNITVLRDGARIPMNVMRAQVTEETVSCRMLDDNIGYLRITSFDNNTYDQFVAAYRELETAGAEAVVFDVRNNPGGTLTSVLAIAEYILPDTSEYGIVHIREKGASYKLSGIYDYYPAYMQGRVYYGNHAVSLPMAVLVNGNTASAGELFTSSLQDYGVARVIGTQTYGKGVGQSSYPLSAGEDAAIVSLTTFFYDPPVSENYNGFGVTPDSVVELPAEALKKNLYRLTAQEDTQLAAAVEYLISAKD